MMKALLLVPLLAACVADAGDDDLSLDETTSALGGDQIAAMNNAAGGTGIGYNQPAPATLAEVFAPNNDIKRTVRARRSDGSYVSEIIIPPDPCTGASCAGASVRLGLATTAWVPPDPCIPPDPCKTRFDVAGANFRVVGTGVESSDGSFVVTVRVTDATGHVVFDSH